MTTRTFRITGRVIDRASQLGVPKLRVEAWDKDLIFDDWVGRSEETDVEGGFLIEFDESRFLDLFPERYPDLYFKIYHGDELIVASTEPVLHDVGRDRQPQSEQAIPFDVNIFIDAPLDLVTVALIVKGTVRRSDGQVVTGLTVRAFDESLRKETLLGEKVLDQSGQYQIDYRPERTGADGKKTANLLVRVFDAESHELAKSAIRYNAQSEESVDLTITSFTKPLPDFESLVQALMPALRGVPLHEISEDVKAGEIVLLAGQTDRDAGHIGWIVRAAKFAREIAATELAPHCLAMQSDSLSSEVLTQVFYAWFSLNLPTTEAELWTCTVTELMAALDTAISKNIVPDSLRDYFGVVEALIRRRVVDEKLRPTGPGASARLGDLLATLPEPLKLSQEQQRTVAELLETAALNEEQFVLKLTESGLTRFQAVGVQRAFRLGDLCLQHAPMAQALHQKTVVDEDASLISLAKLRPDEWLDLVFAHGTPANSDLDTAAYARQMQLQIEELHPTAVLAARFKTRLMYFQRSGFAEVGHFLDSNPDFDILQANIERLDKTAHFDGIENKEQVIGSLLKLQRVKKLTATWEESIFLINTGLDSAYAAVNFGPQRMRKTLAAYIEPERIATLHGNAVSIHDTSLALLTHMAPRFSPPEITAISDPRKNIDTSLLEDYPTLQQLFGPQDYCECRHCQSVLSPSAYFVDLLNFLNPLPSGQELSAQPAYQALIKRRPDLIDLELSCVNTEAEMPYIDLTLEILENAVALPYPIDISLHEEILSAILVDKTDVLIMLVQQALANPDLPPHFPPIYVELAKAIAKALNDTSLEVGTLVGETPYSANTGLHWTIRDDHRLWKLRYERDAFYAGPDSFPRKGEAPHPLLFPNDLDQGMLPSTQQVQVKNAFENWLRPLMSTDPYLLPSGSDWVSKYPGLLLETLPFSGISGLSDWRISPITKGSTWKLHFQKTLLVCRGVSSQNKAEITLGNLVELNNIIYSTDTHHLPYSENAITQEMDSLKSGNIGALLDSILPKYHYTIVQISNEPEKYLLYVNDTLTISYVRESLTIDAIVYQSSSTDRDLMACPENRNPAAYEICRTIADFPWTLPFDLPLQEVRAILERMGTSRLKLMEICHPNAGPCTEANEAIACEFLGLSRQEADSIAISADDNDDLLWRIWGLKLDGDGNTCIRDSRADEEVYGKPLDVLSNASILMQQARLSFQELQDVLQARFVGGKIPPQFKVSSLVECIPSKIRLTGITQIHLDRIHRFVRLWRKLSWKAWEVDMAWNAILRFITPETLHDYPLEQIVCFSYLQRLRDSLDLSVEELVSLWGKLGVPVYRDYGKPGQPEITPLYDRIFLDPLLHNPPDADFKLDDTRLKLIASSKTITEKSPYIAASLGITERNIQELMSLGIKDELNLESLFELYRNTLLCKTLGLKTEDLVRFVYTSSTQDNAAIPLWELLLKGYETIEFVRDSGFTVWRQLSCPV